MKNRRLKVFVIGFFCISCCSWTSVAGDDLQKALGLLKAKLLNLAEQLDDLPFYNPPEISIDELKNDGLNLRSDTKTPDKIQGKNGLLCVVYDINTPVRQGDNTYSIWAKKPLYSSVYAAHCGYGCGLHSMKNLIFMTKTLLEKDAAKRKEIIADMNRHEVFLHYVEGDNKGASTTDRTLWRQPWIGDEAGKDNWIKIWSSVGKSSHFDDPAALLADTIRLRDAIKTGEAFAPAFSKKVLRHAVILGDINVCAKVVYNLWWSLYGWKKQQSNNSKFWNDGIKDIKMILLNKKHFVIPIHAYYTHPSSRHWMAVVLRKIVDDKLEIFFIDSDHSGFKPGTQRRFLGAILCGLGIVDSPDVFNLPH